MPTTAGAPQEADRADVKRTGRAAKEQPSASTICWQNVPTRRRPPACGTSQTGGAPQLFLLLARVPYDELSGGRLGEPSHLNNAWRSFQVPACGHKTVTYRRRPLSRPFRLVATALPARDTAAVVPLDRGGLHAAALSWADPNATWADADGGVISSAVPIVAVAVAPDLNINLGHLELLLGLGRSGERGSRQHRCGCRHDEGDLHHWASSFA